METRIGQGRLRKIDSPPAIHVNLVLLASRYLGLVRLLAHDGIPPSCTQPVFWYKAAWMSIEIIFTFLSRLFISWDWILHMSISIFWITTDMLAFLPIILSIYRRALYNAQIGWVPRLDIWHETNSGWKRCEMQDIQIITSRLVRYKCTSSKTVLTALIKTTVEPNISGFLSQVPFLRGLRIWVGKIRTLQICWWSFKFGMKQFIANCDWDLGYSSCFLPLSWKGKAGSHRCNIMRW